jgi:hypothetical protein
MAQYYAGKHSQKCCTFFDVLFVGDFFVGDNGGSEILRIWHTIYIIAA